MSPGIQVLLIKTFHLSKFILLTKAFDKEVDLVPLQPKPIKKALKSLKY